MSIRFLDVKNRKVYLSSMNYAETAKAIKGLGSISIPLVKDISTHPPSRNCQFQEQVDHMHESLSSLSETVIDLEKLLDGVLRAVPTPPTKESQPEPSLVPVAEVVRTFIKHVQQATEHLRSIRERLEV